MANYRAGFNQCANEVNRNILANTANTQLREKFMSHLASYCHGNANNRVATRHVPGIPAMTPSFPAISPSAVWVPYPSPPPSPQSKSAVFISVDPVKHDIPMIHSPVGPSVAPVLTSSLSPANSTNAAAKSSLWRPW